MNQCVQCGQQVIGLHVCQSNQSSPWTAADYQREAARAWDERKHYRDEAMELRVKLQQAELQIDDLKKALGALYKTVPAIGHHDLPTYDCPARDLAKAMNRAAELLEFPKPYPISEKQKLCPRCGVELSEKFWWLHPNDCAKKQIPATIVLSERGLEKLADTLKNPVPMAPGLQKLTEKRVEEPPKNGVLYWFAEIDRKEKERCEVCRRHDPRPKDYVWPLWFSSTMHYLTDDPTLATRFSTKEECESFLAQPKMVHWHLYPTDHLFCP